MLYMLTNSKLFNKLIANGNHVIKALRSKYGRPIDRRPANDDKHVYFHTIYHHLITYIYIKSYFFSNNFALVFPYL